MLQSKDTERIARARAYLDFVDEYARQMIVKASGGWSRADKYTKRYAKDVINRLQNLQGLVSLAKNELGKDGAHHALWNCIVGVENVRSAFQAAGDTNSLTVPIDEFAGYLQQMLASVDLRLKSCLTELGFFVGKPTG